MATPDFTRSRLETLLAREVVGAELDELVALNTELSVRRDQIKEKQRAIAAQLDGEAAMREARVRLEAMPENIREAVAQVVRLDGIPSAEAIG